MIIFYQIVFDIANYNVINFTLITCNILVFKKYKKATYVYN